MESKKIKRNSKPRKPFKPAYVKVYSTLGITAGLVCVQLLITTMLVLYDKPDAIPVYPDREKFKMLVWCVKNFLQERKTSSGVHIWPKSRF